MHLFWLRIKHGIIDDHDIQPNVNKICWHGEVASGFYFLHQKFLICQ